MSAADLQRWDLLTEFLGLQSELPEDKVLNKLITAEYRVLLERGCPLGQENRSPKYPFIPQSGFCIYCLFSHQK